MSSICSKYKLAFRIVLLLFWFCLCLLTRWNVFDKFEALTLIQDFMRNKIEIF